jgi:predicted DsbA family dithiol-disulfide isomerase
MQVEIWSDVVCPFCYIGKRQLEAALEQLPGRDDVQVTWRSFQLGPDTKTDPSRNAIQNLAEKKGWTLEFTRQAVADVSNRAQAVGLAFDYERTKVANTFDAHRLVHYATGAGKGDDVAEALFRAYFVDGRNVGDHDTLAQLAAGAGLPEDEVREVLRSGRFADEVRRDLQTAAQFGINSVPCFVLDRKYAVSGAQGSPVLLQALQRALTETAGNAAVTP